jgi:AcrR family transcriptional regulator
MGRTREAALAGALAAVAKYGSRKATMGDIASLAGIAKATLYNHFRARRDVYAAAVLAEVDSVAEAAKKVLTQGFDAALAEATKLLAEHGALRKIAAEEPAVLMALATVSNGEGWTATRAHVSKALVLAGYQDRAATVDLISRYLASQLLAPSAPAERVETVALITDAASRMTDAAGPGEPAAAGRAIADQSRAASVPDSDPAGSAHTSS